MLHLSKHQTSPLSAELSKHPTSVETTKYCTDSLCKLNLHKRWSKNNSNKTFEESPSQNLHTYTLTMNACKQKRSTFCFKTPGAKFNQCLHYPTLWIQTLCPKSKNCTHHYSTHLFTSFAASCNPITSSCLLAGVVLQSFLVGLSDRRNMEKTATQTSNIKRPGDCPLCWDGFAGQGMLLTSTPDSSDAIGAIRTTTLQHQRAAIPGWLFQSWSFCCHSSVFTHDGSQPHNFESLNDLTISYDIYRYLVSGIIWM